MAAKGNNIEEKSRKFNPVSLFLSALVAIFLIVSVGFSQVSAGPHHMSHTYMSVCSALCEIPGSRTTSSKESSHSASAHEHEMETEEHTSLTTDNSETTTHMNMGMSVHHWTDTVPIHKQVSVYLN